MVFPLQIADNVFNINNVDNILLKKNRWHALVFKF